MSIGNILLALLVFSFIIIFHEFGHFIVARFNKVNVIEFSLGMGPRLISWGKTPEGRKLLFFRGNQYFEDHPEYEGHTIYSWKILPFGGSCMMLGEEESVEDEHSFSSKSVYARMAIIFAGPFFNFLLAFLLSLVLIGSIGYDSAKVMQLDENMPMAKAGVEAGDVIKEINGKKIVLSGELGVYLSFHPLDGNAVDLVLDRNGEEIDVSVTPQEVVNENNRSYKLGFAYGAREKTGFFGTIGYSAYEVKYWISTVLQSLGQMIQGRVSRKDISGPVGIVKIVSSEVDESAKNGEDTGDKVKNVLLTLVNLCILLTANLGVMNLIPVPALDGGRLVFLIFEWIRKKPLPERIENATNMAGFSLLMLLMVFILVNDVINLF